jgi:hypothetical protein
LGYETSEKHEGFRRLNAGSRQVEWHLLRSTWERHIHNAGFNIYAAVTGFRQNIEFIWIVGLRPYSFSPDILREIRNMEHRYLKRAQAVPLSRRLRTITRWLVGERVYETIKRLVKGTPPKNGS